MSLAKRIIPVLLARDGMLVKGKQFNSGRVVGYVQQAAEIHQGREVDEMLVLDVNATLCGRDPDYEMVKGLTEKCFMPIAVGGGVQTIEHVRRLLASGADKVVIGSYAHNHLKEIDVLAGKFGSQAIVVAIDAVKTASGWVPTSHCGREQYPYCAVTYAMALENSGVGEIIVTNIKNDGMMKGYDLSLIRAISERVDVPIIANGGCGTYEHMHQALKMGASAVAAGAMFQFLDLTPKGAAEYLAKKGWVTR